MAKLNLLTVLASTSLINIALAAYSLADSYTASNFFDSFIFFDGKDPTNGFVQYKDLKTAAKSGLIAIEGTGDNAAVYMGVDHKTKDPAGRASVRISSKKSYNHGLFLFDIEHNPGSICGTWPAFWLLSDSGKWPVGGEIDIFEGVNEQSDNKMTLHTTPGCLIKNTDFSGEVETPNCDVNAPGQGANMGCGILYPKGKAHSYGKSMNAVGGGVYATMWTSQDIRVYYFPRSSIPKDITMGKPDPPKWGMPAAKFAAGCNIDQHFSGLNIIFNTAFCGDWAGDASVWDKSRCKAKAPTCKEYVQNNPEAFKDAYWMIRSVKVYQEGKTMSRRNEAGDVFAQIMPEMDMSLAETSRKDNSSNVLDEEGAPVSGMDDSADDAEDDLLVKRNWFPEAFRGWKTGIKCTFTGDKDACGYE
ncbi:MAG: hypothetical protein Q9177_005978 [Variospora cf. flavescens]